MLTRHQRYCVLLGASVAVLVIAVACELWISVAPAVVSGVLAWRGVCTTTSLRRP